MEDTSATYRPKWKVRLPSVGELLQNAKDVVFKRPAFFFGLALIPAIVDALSNLFSRYRPTDYVFFALMVITSILLSILVGIAMIQAAADEEAGEFASALQHSAGLFWPAIWAAIIVFIVTIIGYLLFIIPGIYFSTALSFYLYAVVLDGKRGWESAAYSWELVKGHWWDVFGRWLAFGLLAALFAVIIWGIVALFGEPVILEVILNGLLTVMIAPIAVVYQLRIYEDLKHEKEGSA